MNRVRVPRRSRIAGYGGRILSRRSGTQQRALSFAAVLAVLTAGAVATALILLLAQQDPLLAVPVALGYGLFLCLLWRGR